jgi:hypothetical protein
LIHFLFVLFDDHGIFCHKIDPFSYELFSFVEEGIRGQMVSKRKHGC